MLTINKYLVSDLANNWIVCQEGTTRLLKFYFSHELLPLAICIFLVGLVGFLESREFLSLLINVELMMLGINFYLLTSSLFWGDSYGQAYALCFLAITASETAIGLGILVLLYRAQGRITFTEFSTLKG
jgi:NADH-quinone oxidoreductase subunit K